MLLSIHFIVTEITRGLLKKKINWKLPITLYETKIKKKKKAKNNFCYKRRKTENLNEHYI